MKALAIDSSSTCITFSVRNEEKSVRLSLDIGMHQSEQLLPSIEHVLSLASLSAADLEFTALCGGPGSFTGLRLSYAALKALQLANGTPIYAIPTLKAIAYPFLQWKGAVVPVIDAKKNRFYAAVYRNGEQNSPDEDAALESIASKLDKEEDILAVGPDAEYFAECLTAAYPEFKVTTLKSFYIDAGQQLLELANKLFLEKAPPMQDYDGPVYIRPSEAEEKRAAGQN